MAAITTRQTAGGGATVAGVPLTNAQLDTNFININLDLPQKFVVSSGQTPGTNIYHGILLDTGTLWTSDHIGKLDYRLISYGQGGGSNGTSLDHEISGFISYYRNTAAGDEVAGGLIDRTHRVYTPIAATVYIVKIKSNGNLGIAFDFGLNSFSTLYITRLVGQLANVGANNWTVHSRYFTGTNLTTALNNTTNFYYVTFASAINSISYTDTIVAPYTNSFIRWSGNTNKTEHLRLDSNGNLGIGTSSPASRLHVEGVSTQSNFIATSGNSTIRIADSVAGANRKEFTAILDTTNNRVDLQAVQQGIGFLPITLNPGGGNVGIGTNSPQARLDVLTEQFIRSGTSGTASTGGTLWLTTGTSGSIRAAGIQAVSEGTANAHSLLFYTNTAGTSPGERMRIDVAGNLGLGVTPSAWGSNFRAIEGTSSAGFSLASANVNGVNILSNAYQTNAGPIYTTTGAASYYAVGGGTNQHRWFVAPSGTAGSAISFTQAMTLDANGRLGIATAAPATALGVAGSAVFSGSAPFVAFSADQGGTTPGYIQYTTSSATLDIVAAGVLRFMAGGTTERVRITSAGNVGIGTINPGYRLEVAGSFAATTKSFVIDHPTKPNMKLRYGSLEGPENGVYVRGRTTNGVIVLPEYWTKLVDPDSITVNLTPVGTHQKLYVDKIESNCVYVLSDGVIDCFYTVFAERVDVDKLQVEV
jgi:hypothetical protein